MIFARATRDFSPPLRFATCVENVFSAEEKLSEIGTQFSVGGCAVQSTNLVDDRGILPQIGKLLVVITQPRVFTPVDLARKRGDGPDECLQ